MADLASLVLEARGGGEALLLATLFGCFGCQVTLRSLFLDFLTGLPVFCLVVSAGKVIYTLHGFNP